MSDPEEYRYSADEVQLPGGMYPTYELVNIKKEVRLVQDPETGEQRWKTVEIPEFPQVRGERYGRTENLFDEESELVGRVCDLLDEANPDLPIEENQRIARDIITLVREYT